MARKQVEVDKKLLKIVRGFFKAKDDFETYENSYKLERNAFYESMDKYFNGFSGSKKSETFEDANGDLLVVTKVSPTKIEWIPEKLKARVTKFVWKKIVRKRYEVNNMAGLVSYLKTCGVNPIIFKGFIEVTETVDEKAIERLGDLGELTPHNIAGCYVISSSKPYYRLQRKKVQVGQE